MQGLASPPSELREGWPFILVLLMGRPAQASQMAYVRAGTSVHIRVYEPLKSITTTLSAIIYWYI